MIKLFFYIFTIILSIFFLSSEYFSNENNLKKIQKNKIIKESNKNVIKNSKNNENNIFSFNENNSTVFNLNNNREILPFHPVKVINYKNNIFYILKGNLLHINIDKKTYIAEIIKVDNNISNKEIINMTLSKEEKKIYLLDKVNNIYSYDIYNKKFLIEYKAKPILQQPDPHYVSLYFDDKLYILDSARNQILYLENGILKRFFRSEIMIWEKERLKERDLSDAISIYSENNNIFVLKRNNLIYKIDKKTKNIKKHKFEYNNKFSYISFSSNLELKNLFFVDSYNGNITLIDKNNFKNKNISVTLNNIVYPIYDIFINEKNDIFILAGNNLIIHKNFKENDILLSSNLNNKFNSNILEEFILKNKINLFLLPLKNVKTIPDHISLLPGARRIYRYGIHEGIDFFTDLEKGIIINKSTPIFSISDGKIIRVDKNYKEMSILEHKKVLKECEEEWETSEKNQDKLRGMQVHILHDNGVKSVYAHLDKIDNNLYEGKKIKKGDLLGYVGNSGTTDGVFNRNVNLHLHFEIHLKDENNNYYYLGKYLGIEETMQIYNEIFRNQIKLK